VATQQIEIRAVDKTRGTLNKVQKNLGRIDKSAKGISLSFGRIAAAATGVFAGLGLVKAATGLIEVGKSLENLEVRLKLLYGSASEGGAAFDEMNKYASEVAFSLEEIQQGAGSLAIVTKDADELANVMRLTGNVAAATGLDFATSSLQMQRALTQGISSADIFRDKGVANMLGFAAGATVSAEQTREAFERVFGKGGKFGKATEMLADTLEGTLSMISDKVFNFKKRMLEVGAFDSLKIQASALNDKLTEMKPELDALAKLFGDKLGFGVFQVAEFIKGLNISMQDLIVGAKVVAAVLGGAGLLAVVKGLTLGIRSLTLMIARNPLGLLAVAASSLIVWLSMENGLGKTITQVIAVFKRLGQLAEKLAKFLYDQLGKVLDFLTEQFDRFVGGVIRGYNAIARFIPFLDEVESSGAQVRAGLKALAVEGFNYVDKAIGDTGKSITKYIDINKLANDAMKNAKLLLEDLTMEWRQAGITYDQASVQQREKYDALIKTAKALQDLKDAEQEANAAGQKNNQTTAAAVSIYKEKADAMIKAASQLNREMAENEIETLRKIKDHALEIQKASLEAKKITEDEFRESKIAIEKNLQEQITQLEADELEKREARHKESMEKRLMASRGSLSDAITDEDKALWKKQGVEKKKKDLIDERAKWERMSTIEQTAFGIGQAKALFGALGKENKKFFAAQKAMAIAEALINTYQGATKALAQGGILGIFMMAGVLAAGFAQISAIRAQTAQRGGTVLGGATALVGEDGPELIVPKQSSTVIPREVADAVGGISGDMGGEVNVNFNITTVDARDFDQLLVERRGTIVGIINNAMNQQGKVGVTA